MMQHMTGGCKSTCWEIPLSVQERSGVSSKKAILSNGLPLPMGALFDTNGLRITDAGGNPVDAGFTPLQRWQDGSLRFVLASFLADLPGKETSRFLLGVNQGCGAIAAPLDVRESGDAIEVSTGYLKIVIDKHHGNVLDKAWYDAEGKGRYHDGNQIVDTHDDGVVAIIGGRAYRSSLGRPFSAQVLACDGVRAEIQLTGALASGAGASGLEYALWIRAYAGSRELEICLNVVNQSGTAWADHLRIDKLALEIPIVRRGKVAYVFGGVGENHGGALEPGQRADLWQHRSYEYQFYDGETRETRRGGRDDKTTCTGWLDVSSGGLGLGIVYRWFWQNYPSGLAADARGLASAQILSARGEAFALYAGVGKTTDFRLCFHDGSETGDAIGARLSAYQTLTVCAAPPSWYCQDTKAVDPRHVDLDPDHYLPEYREDIALYLRGFEAAFDSLVAARDVHALYAPGMDGYGFMNFGDGPVSGGSTPSSEQLTWWSNNYYDHPNVPLVCFLRTGEVKYLEYALQNQYHLMDIDTVGYNPVTGVPGVYRSCPGVYHIKRYNQPYETPDGGKDYAFASQSDHWVFQGVEGLFNTYYLFGLRPALDRGMLAAELAHQTETLNFHTETRTIGHTLDGLCAAYRHTWDQKYLDKMIHVWGRVVGHANTDHAGESEDWPYFKEFDPYVYVQNTPFQTGIMMGGAYHFRAFSPDVIGRNGVDNVLIQTLRQELYRSQRPDVGKQYLRLDGATMWTTAPSIVMLESSAYLRTLYPHVDFFEKLLQVFRRSMETGFADNNKRFSQAFKFMWSMHYEMAKPELKDRAYASFTAYPAAIRPNGTVTFNNQSIAAERCVWDFGDGSGCEESAVNIHHRYKKPGRYTVTLTVTDASGRTDALTINDYIACEAGARRQPD